MTEATKRPAPPAYRKAPRAHEWELWSAGVWRCAWCDGFCRSEKMPHPDAPAMSHEDAAAAILAQEQERVK